MGSEDEEQLVKRKRPQQSQAPRLAAGSESFGRALPPGVADEIERLRRDGTVEPTTFGEHELKVEHHDRAIVLVFPDGIRAIGTPEQARDLAKLLLGPMPTRR